MPLGLLEQWLSNGGHTSITWELVRAVNLGTLPQMYCNRNWGCDPQSLF